MDQKIEPLSPTDAADVSAKRKWVRDHFIPEKQHLYEELDQKLRLVDGILRNKWIQPSETLKLQCLGIALGDALAQKLGLEWVAVEDEYGRDPAIRLPGTSILLFPLTMISKRIEKGEEVDVHRLFEVLCDHVERLKRKPD